MPVTALLAYDLLLNISREADLIWRQKWRASTVIYFFLRYPVVAFQVFNAYASVHKTPQYVLRSLALLNTSLISLLPFAQMRRPLQVHMGFLGHINKDSHNR